MNDLSPTAQQLARAGAKAARPTDADRERLFEAMRGRLGDAAMLGVAGAVVSRSWVHATWVKVSALTVGAGLVVGAAGLALRPTPELAVSPVAPSPAVRAPAAVPVAEALSAPAIAAPADAPAPVAAAAGAALSAGRRSPDRLAQEVALLSRATSALRSGRAEDALKALGEHQSQFPKGVLAEERGAARAQALCALGRRSEAEVELARLAKSAPQSPQAARARQACSAKR